MRKNEYSSIEEFKAEYVGEWNPSGGHWLGIDFIYKNDEYRMNTGSMYNEKSTILPDGRTAIFGLYKKDEDSRDENEYVLLEEFASMEDLLETTIIGGEKFAEIIMDDDTEILGKD